MVYAYNQKLGRERERRYSMICICPRICSLCKTSVCNCIKHSYLFRQWRPKFYLCMGIAHFQGKSNVQESNCKKSSLTIYVRTAAIIQDLRRKRKVSIHLNQLKFSNLAKAKRCVQWVFPHQQSTLSNPSHEIYIAKR